MKLPERLPLAQLPTPMTPMPRERLAALLADGAGNWQGAPQDLPQVLIKHDEQTGFLVSGNKIRKLEFVLADARAQGATHVITCGGWQSNHCRATAVACRRLGIEPVLLLRVDEPAAELPLTGNYLLDRVVGAHIVRVSRREYAERAARMAALADEVRAAGHRPYVIPEGASNGLGSVGYVEAVREIGQQAAVGDHEPLSALVVAVGSGGTAAGLQLGADVYPGIVERILAVCVCDDAAYFRARCATIREEARGWLADGEAGEANTPLDEPATPLEFDDAHIGPGYAIPYPAMMRDLAALGRHMGIVLDPVYSGKAWHALLQRLRRDPGSLGERVAFVHTGGTFGLFAHGQALAEVLPAS